MRAHRILIGVAALLALSVAVALLVRDRDALITVRPGETHQTMKGWEVTARAWETNKKDDRFDASWEQYKDALFDRLVGELGINRVRIEIKSGVENPVDWWARFRAGQVGYREYREHYYEKINDNDDPNVTNPAGFQFSMLDYQVENVVQPLARRLAARGEKLYVNLMYVDFGQTARKGSLSHAEQPQEYAELIAAAVRHLKSRHGLVPDGLGVILEPENTEQWRGQQIGAAMVATARRLQEAGLPVPEFIAPSTTAASAAPAYFDDIVKVPGAAQLLGELSYHRYRDGPAANDVLPDIARRAAHHKVRTAMLEHVGGNAAELLADLTMANVSAWQQYGIAAKLEAGDRDAGGGYYNLVAEAGGPVLRMADRTRSLAQYFRFVRAGATRVGATSDSVAQVPVAFRNPDGTLVVVVQGQREAAIRIAGLPPGAYDVRYTTAKDTVAPAPTAHVDAGGMLAAHLPAKGVLTVYQTKAP